MCAGVIPLYAQMCIRDRGKGTRITVTLPNEKSPVYRINDPAFDYVGGFDHVLVEMADALSPKAYAEKSAASQ